MSPGGHLSVRIVIGLFEHRFVASFERGDVRGTLFDIATVSEADLVLLFDALLAGVDVIHL
ncbi:hypothetical protein [Halosimplex carlsbadense]|uniref:hypothetical protein n=1 Tax=Halosimplex carlsbadense TaxID=171164 RepID=UPI0012697DA0|nr:hypothetical protein [Halosimplex carlsbadense]